MSRPLNLIGGFAEFLPFADGSFDTVNMRSCIDHFFNADLSLLEANRVLTEKGKLIVGMTVETTQAKEQLKDAARKVLGLFTDRFEDKHIWHPSKEELTALCKRYGFILEDEIWQNEKVWYAAFRKQPGQRVIIT